MDGDGDVESPSFPWVMTIPAVHWLIAGMVLLAVFMLMVLGSIVFAGFGGLKVDPLNCMLPVVFLVFIKAGLGLFHGDPRLIGLASIISAILGGSLAVWGILHMIEARFGLEAFMFSEGIMLIGSTAITYVMRTNWNDWAANRAMDSRPEAIETTRTSNSKKS